MGTDHIEDLNEAVRKLAVDIRKRKLTTLDIGVFLSMQTAFLTEKKYFDAWCSSEVIKAWQKEFPNYKTITIGQFDMILSKYFK